MKKQEKKYELDVNEEYGLEFGDINAAKFYEIPLANEIKNRKRKKPKKK